MAQYRKSSRPSWPSRIEPEGGFTLVEVLVALGVIFTTLLLLAFSMFSSFAAVGFSRQRTQASALANQTLEQIRALPYDMLYMSQSDLAGGGDSQIKSCTTPVGAYCFLTAAGRQIPAATFGSGTPLTPFFNPTAHPANQSDHVTSLTGSPGTTRYTTKSYVTLDPTDLSGGTKIVTVQVSWSPAQVGGAQSNLQVESKIYTSPFSESSPGATTTTTIPAVHSWTASAQSQPGTISVSGSVLNVPVANVTFNLPTATAYLSGNTTKSGSGTDVGPAGHPVTAGTASGGISLGGSCVAACTAAAFTPAAPHTQSLAGASGADGPYNAGATPGLLGSIPGSQSVGINVLGSTLNGQLTAGSITSAGAVAASAASGATLNVPSGGGVLPSTNLGYGKASAIQTGPLSSNLAMTVLGLPALSLGLVNMTPTGNGPAGPDTAVVQQTGSAGVPLSQTYNASAASSFSDLSVVSGLPLLGPLVDVSLFKSSASACAGPASCAASTATESGHVTILGVAVPIDLATASPGVVVGIPPVNVTTGVLNISATIGVTIGAHTTVGNGSASVTSPLAITVALKITVLGTTVVNLNVAVNLGSLATTASYS